MFQKHRGQDSHLYRQISMKNTNLVDNIKCLLTVILFSSWREVENIGLSETRSVIFVDGFSWKRTSSASVQLSFVKFRSVVAKGKSKMPQQIRGRPAIFVDGSSRKTQNRKKTLYTASRHFFFHILFNCFREVENVSASVTIFANGLLPVKFRQSLFSSCREAENVKSYRMTYGRTMWTTYGWTKGSCAI